jgi:hypothetical protein
MNEILKEISEWKCDYQVANNIYLLQNNKLVAYIYEGTEDIIKLKKPIMFDKRYRKFIKIKNNELAKLLTKPVNNARLFNVKSKDKEYTVQVENDNFSCTCTGFTYRGKCKHIEAVKDKL